MDLIVQATQFFADQLNELSPSSRRILEKKLLLLKYNPFRNKRIHGYPLFLFRIRVEDNRKEKRVIYLVNKPTVTILCIIDRDSDYNNLRDFLRRSGYL
jgi:mRNA-degrading endonuclease RelE of RelBE toxin-antitoxin system